MKISVITVCFNSAATVAVALQSVAEQDWKDIEHIVVDGASTDGTLDIIEKFNPYLSTVISEIDSGIYDAMNKGLRCATGEIVCFLNADDKYANKSVLSRIASEMQNSKLDALFGDVSFFSEKKFNQLTRRYRSDRFSPRRLSWGWMPAHPALFLRANVVKRVGYFKKNYKIAGDFEFIVRAFHGQNLSYKHIPEVLVLMQSGGISTNGWRSKIILNKEVLQACRENGLKTNIFKILSKYPFKILELFKK